MMKLRKLSLTYDMAIYGLLYICFVVFICPLLAYLLRNAGMTPAEFSVIAWRICWYSKAYLYVPVVLVISIIALIELRTDKFLDWRVFWTVKLVGVLFLVYIMIALALPLVYSLVWNPPIDGYYDTGDYVESLIEW
jgi:nitrogen fixation/metabolism regulation signal transduction histidine kinase